MDKVMVVVPCSDGIYPDTMKCIWDLWKEVDGYEIDFDFVRGYSVDLSRNRCVMKALEEGATHILFVDNDMTFDKEFLNYLMEHEEPVVMGYYDHRSYDPNDTKERTNLCKLEQHDYIEQVTVDEIRDAESEGYELVEVKGGGLGFCLIDMRVFQCIYYPYFKFIEWNDGSVLSEDLYFSEQLANAGIRVYADTRCYCGHIFRRRHGGNETVHKD